MKKINIFTPFASDGTSFYRAYGVFNQIAQKENLPVIFESNTKITWADMGQYHLLYAHRTHHNTHSDLIRMARALKIPVWVDWDDDIINIPPSNPVYKQYKDNTVKEIISLADVVTTTTQAMADNYGATNAVVIENFIPLDVQYLPPVKTEKFRIFWRGSNTHERDWYVCKNALYKFLQGKTDVQFVCMGDIPNTILFDVQYLCDVRKIEGAETIKYLQYMQHQNIADLCFVPLEDIPFNRAKSDCAVKETLLNGMLSLTPEWNNSDVYCYKDVTEIQQKLEDAYLLWKNDFNGFASKVTFQQRKTREHAQKNYNKRLELLKKILNL